VRLELGPVLLDDTRECSLVAGPSRVDKLPLLGRGQNGSHPHQKKTRAGAETHRSVDEFGELRRSNEAGMRPPSLDPVVHLELHTGNRVRASDLYTRLFGWHAETVDVGHCTYLSLKLGDRIEGGIVAHDGEGSLWLPYVEVADLVEVIERARALGAAVALEPREGPVGWRSILAVPSGARVALWPSKV
jgi:uncharacterized protein